MNNLKHIFMMNKKRINKRLLPLLLGGLLLTACSNENVWSYDEGKADDGEYVDVNFSVNPQNELATRATVENGKYVPTIAQGKQVDVLIYAVYEVVRNENEDGRPIEKYRRLEQYGNGYVDTDGNKPSDTPSVTVGVGQTVVKKPFTGTLEDGKLGTYTTTLRLMRNKEYAIAFWAQNSKTKAYDTKNLEEVVVNYKEAANNDELRDAFCKVEMFTVSPNQNINVILQRPLAQINAGTTGADYYNHLSFHNDKPVLYSSITLTGVANCINVVKDEISSTPDFKEKEKNTITFTPAKIAAYWDIETLPNADDLDQILGSDDPNAKGSQTGSTTNTPTAKYLEKEEFLMINLDGHPQQVKHEKDINSMGYLKYKTAYPTLTEDGEFLTETFKYISMCYVLVPTSNNSGTNAEPNTDKYYSSTLEKVTITMHNQKENATYNRNIYVENVPVHRNWRTNILGGLSKGTTNHPTDPDDPSSFFEGSVSAKIYLSPTYEGEYNSKDEGNSWHQDKYGDN